MESKNLKELIDGIHKEEVPGKYIAAMQQRVRKLWKTTRFCPTLFEEIIKAERELAAWWYDGFQWKPEEYQIEQVFHRVSQEAYLRDAFYHDIKEELVQAKMEVDSKKRLRDEVKSKGGDEKGKQQKEEEEEEQEEKEEKIQKREESQSGTSKDHARSQAKQEVR